jgi:O-antigen/teichoic acid export membrane protein
MMRRAALPGLLRRGGVYAVKAANLGAGVVVTLLLARLGGPESLGSYALAIQTAQLVSILAVLGCDWLLLREVAANLRLGDRATAASAMRHYGRFVMPLALLVTLAYFGLILLLGWLGMPLAQDPAMIAGTGFVTANVVYLMGLGAMRGLGDPLRAQVYDGLYLVPMALLLGGLVLIGQPIGTPAAVGLSTLLLVLTMAGLIASIVRTTRAWGRADDARFASPWREGVPLMISAFLVYLLQWLPLFLAGALGSAADAGSFRAAWQLAFPLAVLQSTTVSAISAGVAGDLREGRLDSARQRLHRNRWGVLALSLPITIPLLIWPEPVMLFLFGPAFAGAGDMVRGLVAINLVSLIAGPVTALITMSGRNSELVPISMISAVLQLLLALWLVPALGMNGLVISYGVAVLLRTASFVRLSGKILRGEG